MQREPCTKPAFAASQTLSQPDSIIDSAALHQRQQQEAA